MGAATATAGRAPRGRRAAYALAPIVLLVAVLSIFAASSDRLFSLLGDNPPPSDQVDVRGVRFVDGAIKLRVTNPQTQDLSIALVTVDESFVPFTLDGPATLGRLDTRTLTVPYHWIQGEPYRIAVTSSNGIQTVHEVGAATPAREFGAGSAFGYLVIGLLVGFVPVALGLIWLPALRNLPKQWMAGLLALTGGLLVFLAVEALFEALKLQAALPTALGGAGLVVLGVAGSLLVLNLAARGLGALDGQAGSPASLAILIALGVGLHNLGEGLAIGSSFALGELALGTLLIVGFAVHNLTEGIGIVAPLAGVQQRVSLSRLLLLACVAGLPTVLGAWIGGFLTSDFLGVLFFALAAGAAIQVVYEIGRYVAKRSSLTAGPVVAGFVLGIAVMYSTGLLVG